MIFAYYFSETKYKKDQTKKINRSPFRDRFVLVGNKWEKYNYIVALPENPRRVESIEKVLESRKKSKNWSPDAMLIVKGKDFIHSAHNALYNTYNIYNEAITKVDVSPQEWSNFAKTHATTATKPKKKRSFSLTKEQTRYKI